MSESSALHSSCSASRASTAPAWTNSAPWPRCPSARPTSTSPARTSSSPNTSADSIQTSCPECSTAPTSHLVNDSSLPSRCAPRRPVPVHRGGRRTPRPPTPGVPVRTRVQDRHRRAAHRNRARSRRHRPGATRRTTGATHRRRFGPHPSPRQRVIPHRRRDRGHPHRQRRPRVISSSAQRRPRNHRVCSRPLGADDGPIAASGRVRPSQHVFSKADPRRAPRIRLREVPGGIPG